jgi:hypothetical protein
MRDTARGGGYVLEEALERVAPDAEADHAARVIDVLDRVCWNDAALAAREEPRSHGERIWDVRGGAVHRALDTADHAPFAIGYEEPVEPAKV